MVGGGESAVAGESRGEVGEEVVALLDALEVVLCLGGLSELLVEESEAVPGLGLEVGEVGAGAEGVLEGGDGLVVGGGLEEALCDEEL